MTKSRLVMSIICAGMIAASGGVEAQTQGSHKMMHGSAQQQNDSQNQNYQSNMQRGMMGGMGMGSGMMGGQGMGSGMMGCQGMGPGMMGGQGMGSGMMGGGMGMGPGMMNGCQGMGMGMMGGMNPMMQNFQSVEDFENFLEETKEQRRKMHTMRFEYMEKMRQPETTVGELKQMKKDMNDLMKEIHGKAERFGGQ